MVTYILHLPGEELKSRQRVLFFMFVCVIERILIIALTMILFSVLLAQVKKHFPKIFSFS